MPKDPMKPLTGGTIMMVLLLFAGLAARGVMESWRREQEARDRERAVMERGLSATERRRLRQEADTRRPPYDLEEAVHALYTKAESGDSYAQAAFGMVLRDSFERGCRIVPEYERVGRLLMGDDYDRVMDGMRLTGNRECMKHFAANYADWFRRSARQGNAHGMYGMHLVSLSHPPHTLEPDYVEAVKWARLAALHAEATDAGLPPRFAALGRVTRTPAREEAERLSPQEMREVEKAVREFTPNRE